MALVAESLVKLTEATAQAAAIRNEIAVMMSENAMTLRLALTGLGSFGSGTYQPEWPLGCGEGAEQPTPAGFADEERGKTGLRASQTGEQQAPPQETLSSGRGLGRAVGSSGRTLGVAQAETAPCEQHRQAGNHGEGEVPGSASDAAADSWKTCQEGEWSQGNNAGASSRGGARKRPNRQYEPSEAVSDGGPLTQAQLRHRIVMRLLKANEMMQHINQRRPQSRPGSSQGRGPPPLDRTWSFGPSAIDSPRKEAARLARTRSWAYADSVQGNPRQPSMSSRNPTTNLTSNPKSRNPNYGPESPQHASPHGTPRRASPTRHPDMTGRSKFTDMENPRPERVQVATKMHQGLKTGDKIMAFGSRSSTHRSGTVRGSGKERFRIAGVEGCKTGGCPEKFELGSHAGVDRQDMTSEAAQRPYLFGSAADVESGPKTSHISLSCLISHKSSPEQATPTGRGHPSARARSPNKNAAKTLSTAPSPDPWKSSGHGRGLGGVDHHAIPPLDLPQVGEVARAHEGSAGVAAEDQMPASRNPNCVLGGAEEDHTPGCPADGIAHRTEDQACRASTPQEQSRVPDVTKEHAHVRGEKGVASGPQDGAPPSPRWWQRASGCAGRTTWRPGCLQP